MIDITLVLAVLIYLKVSFVVYYGLKVNIEWPDFVQITLDLVTRFTTLFTQALHRRHTAVARGVEDNKKRAAKYETSKADWHL